MAKYRQGPAVIVDNQLSQKECERRNAGIEQAVGDAATNNANYKYLVYGLQSRLSLAVNKIGCRTPADGCLEIGGEFISFSSLKPTR